MTVDTETTTALGATTPEATVPASAVPEAAVPAVAVPAVAQPPRPAPDFVIAQVYVCKKHAAGVAYISIDGASFCSLCLKRFLERYVKPMTKLETKVVPVAAAVAVKETP